MARVTVIIIFTGIIVLVVAAIISMSTSGGVMTGGIFYSSPQNNIASTTVVTTTATSSVPVFVVTHIAPPESIKGIYFTSWAAGTPSFRKNLNSLLTGTILNAVVIDVKDYSGRISFEVDDPMLKKIGAVEKRIPDIKEFIGSLHDRGVYVIGRIAVFQDPFIVKVRPEWAIHDAATGALWRDSGKAYWADPTIHDVWKYNAAIAREAYAVGFDEINFDYVRFPSDGAVGSAKYAALPKAATTTGPTIMTKVGTTTVSRVSTIWITGKQRNMRNFFSFLHDELSSGSTSPRVPISVDLFGQVTSDTGDMGIGQKLEDAMPYFDFIDPMVYPSHYINGFGGFEKPAAHPYEIVKYEMDQAVTRSVAASSSPLLMRPWLQAFDLGAIYTPEMVRTQIRATYDAGLTSWILWNAGSVYNKTALLTDPKPTATSSVTSTTP